jgi:hypothetical protein
MEDKMSELDSRVTALTIAIRNLFDLLERKEVMTFPEREKLLSDAAAELERLPAMSPDINNDGKRTLGALWLPPGSPKDTTI